MALSPANHGNHAARVAAASAELEAEGAELSSDVSFAEPLDEELELTTAGLEPATLPDRKETVPNSPETLILAIETSCDETSAAVLRGDRTILANVVSSQSALHERYGGIVPELASRAHVQAINPALAEGQDLGAATMGMGIGLFEELIYEGAQLMNGSILDYRLPRFSDLPKEVELHLVQNQDGVGPYGAKGGGEASLNSMAANIANAVDSAVGVRIRQAPLTPERVWRALKEKKGR